MKQIKTGFLKTCIGLTLVVGTMANANFGDPTSMMSSFGGQNFAQPQTQMQQFNGNSMPWGIQAYNQPRYSNSRYAAPRQRYAYNPIPWPMDGASSRQAQPVQSFGGMNMMPFNPGIPQQQVRQPQSSSFMMPGMDQGIRRMMEPGKIMAEEATPGMYMKPTWR
ncbi:hypothetical protein BHECKSOX_1164 [Bathymodiolus heckerae thiotrophic gill symbiont]|uniref:hypothetical protein n=1 Tax=Bathymodiolus heckerae thiotrophic gill symbiont TaxID=1052212 RepID=UPI0010B102D6|nr:hypothetical protein [Bathymodiolus heckerae thiotrophic gill symbiont]SHN90971.1 hypothetical protein BHECKSOX_1164 [Bathymodiolus heckerae thiotrophic gill symbiont]